MPSTATAIRYVHATATATGIRYTTTTATIVPDATATGICNTTATAIRTRSTATGIPTRSTATGIPTTRSTATAVPTRSTATAIGPACRHRPGRCWGCLGDVVVDRGGQSITFGGFHILRHRTSICELHII